MGSNTSQDDIEKQVATEPILGEFEKKVINRKNKFNDISSYQNVFKVNDNISEKTGITNAYKLGETVIWMGLNNDLRKGTSGIVVDISNSNLTVKFPNGVWHCPPNGLHKKPSLSGTWSLSGQDNESSDKEFHYTMDLIQIGKKVTGTCSNGFNVFGSVSNGIFSFSQSIGKYHNFNSCTCNISSSGEVSNGKWKQPSTGRNGVFRIKLEKLKFDGNATARLGTPIESPIYYELGDHVSVLIRKRWRSAQVIDVEYENQMYICKVYSNIVHESSYSVDIDISFQDSQKKIRQRVVDKNTPTPTPTGDSVGMPDRNISAGLKEISNCGIPNLELVRQYLE